MTARTNKPPKHNNTTPINTDQIIRTHIGDNKANKYGINTNQPKTKPPPIVAITWEDAITVGNEWETPQQTQQTTPEPTISIGYLIHKTPTHHTLASTINTQHIGGGILIPNGCITNITHLNPPKTTK